MACIFPQDRLFLRLQSLCFPSSKVYFIQRCRLTSQARASFAQSRLKAQNLIACANDNRFSSNKHGLQASSCVKRDVSCSCFNSAYCQLSSVCSQQQHRIPVGMTLQKWHAAHARRSLSTSSGCGHTYSTVYSLLMRSAALLLRSRAFEHAVLGYNCSHGSGGSRMAAGEQAVPDRRLVCAIKIQISIGV